MSTPGSGFFFTFFNADIAAQYAPAILQGMLVTIGVGIAVVISGLIWGLVLALLRATDQVLVRRLIIAFSDIVRSLPPLVIIFLLYFGLPPLGLQLSSFAAAWLSLSIVLAAYAQESIFAGVSALPRGQMEAARSTGLGWWSAMRWVILPQALRQAVPPLTNRVISTTKNTALASVVALSEILSASQTASAVSGNPTPLTVGAFLYLLVFLPIVVFSRWLERRADQH